MNTVPTEPPVGEDHPHFKLIAGLMELAGFLASRPDLPVGRFDYCQLTITAPSRLSDSEMIALVNEVGRVLDVEPHWSGPSHVYADRDFGPVKVRGQAALQAAMEAYYQEQALIKAAREVKRAAAETVEMAVVVDGPAAGPVDVDEGKADAEQDTRQCPECVDNPTDTCRTCFGTGRVLVDPPRCAGCGGTGRAVDEFCIATSQPCGFCQGTGYQQRAAATW